MFMVWEHAALRAVAPFFASISPLLFSDIIWLTRHYEYHIRFALLRSVEHINEDVERMNKLNI